MSSIADRVDGAVEDDVFHIRQSADDVEEQFRPVPALNVHDGVSAVDPVLHGDRGRRFRRRIMR